MGDLDQTINSQMDEDNDNDKEEKENELKKIMVQIKKLQEKKFGTND